jgi:hypothetical protein
MNKNNSPYGLENNEKIQHEENHHQSTASRVVEYLPFEPANGMNFSPNLEFRDEIHSIETQRHEYVESNHWENSNSIRQNHEYNGDFVLEESPNFMINEEVPIFPFKAETDKCITLYATDVPNGHVDIKATNIITIIDSGGNDLFEAKAILNSLNQVGAQPAGIINIENDVSIEKPKIFPSVNGTISSALYNNLRPDIDYKEGIVTKSHKENNELPAGTEITNHEQGFLHGTIFQVGLAREQNVKPNVKISRGLNERRFVGKAKKPFLFDSLTHETIPAELINSIIKGSIVPPVIKISKQSNRYLNAMDINAIKLSKKQPDPIIENKNKPLSTYEEANKDDLNMPVLQTPSKFLVADNVLKKEFEIHVAIPSPIEITIHSANGEEENKGDLIADNVMENDLAIQVPTTSHKEIIIDSLKGDESKKDDLNMPVLQTPSKLLVADNVLEKEFEIHVAIPICKEIIMDSANSEEANKDDLNMPVFQTPSKLFVTDNVLEKEFEIHVAIPSCKEIIMDSANSEEAKKDDLNMPVFQIPSKLLVTDNVLGKEFEIHVAIPSPIEITMHSANGEEEKKGDLIADNVMENDLAIYVPTTSHKEIIIDSLKGDESKKDDLNMPVLQTPSKLLVADNVLEKEFEIHVAIPICKEIIMDSANSEEANKDDLNMPVFQTPSKLFVTDNVLEKEFEIHVAIPSPIEITMHSASGEEEKKGDLIADNVMENDLAIYVPITSHKEIIIDSFKGDESKKDAMKMPVLQTIAAYNVLKEEIGFDIHEAIIGRTEIMLDAFEGERRVADSGDNVLSADAKLLNPAYTFNIDKVVKMDRSSKLLTSFIKVKRPKSIVLNNYSGEIILPEIMPIDKKLSDQNEVATAELQKSLILNEDNGFDQQDAKHLLDAHSNHSEVKLEVGLLKEPVKSIRKSFFNLGSSKSISKSQPNSVENKSAEEKDLIARELHNKQNTAVQRELQKGVCKTEGNALHNNDETQDEVAPSDNSDGKLAPGVLKEKSKSIRKSFLNIGSSKNISKSQLNSVSNLTENKSTNEKIAKELQNNQSSAVQSELQKGLITIEDNSLHNNGQTQAEVAQSDNSDLGLSKEKSKTIRKSFFNLGSSKSISKSQLNSVENKSAEEKDLIARELHNKQNTAVQRELQKGVCKTEGNALHNNDETQDEVAPSDNSDGKLAPGVLKEKSKSIRKSFLNIGSSKNISKSQLNSVSNLTENKSTNEKIAKELQNNQSSAVQSELQKGLITIEDNSLHNNGQTQAEVAQSDNSDLGLSKEKSKTIRKSFFNLGSSKSISKSQLNSVENKLAEAKDLIAKESQIQKLNVEDKIKLSTEDLPKVTKQLK